MESDRTALTKLRVPPVKHVHAGPGLRFIENGIRRRKGEERECDSKSPWHVDLFEISVCPR
jgi:hypothetical protein